MVLKVFDQDVLPNRTSKIQLYIYAVYHILMPNRPHLATGIVLLRMVPAGYMVTPIQMVHQGHGGLVTDHIAT